jgi:hypothetical protein
MAIGVVRLAIGPETVSADRKMAFAADPSVAISSATPELTLKQRETISRLEKHGMLLRIGLDGAMTVSVGNLEGDQVERKEKDDEFRS